MLPLKCDSAGWRAVPATIGLILVSLLLFLLQHHLHWLPAGCVPVDLTYTLFHPLENGHLFLRSLVLSFFIHAGWIHLLSNMWYLWIFGPAVETHIGSLRFVLLYLACGALSMIIQAGSTPLSQVPIVGASGAIAGIMGLHMVLLPLGKILIWLPPLFFVRIFSFLFLGLWFWLQYLSLKGSSAAESTVAWWAHIGGYVLGSLAGLVFRFRTPRKASGKR